MARSRRWNRATCAVDCATRDQPEPTWDSARLSLRPLVVPLQRYSRLIRDFIDHNINVNDFAHEFFELRSKERTWAKPAEPAISDLWAALEAYVPPGLGPSSITVPDIEEMAAQLLQQINELTDPDVRTFERPEEVIEGLRDPDPEIRGYSAVVARSFPGSDRVRTTLRNRLMDDDRTIRGKAAESLAVIGDVDSLAQILELLHQAPVSSYTPEAWAVARLAQLAPDQRKDAREALTGWAHRQHRRLDEADVAPLLAMVDKDQT
jgi:HEAT repeat protein